MTEAEVQSRPASKEPEPDDIHIDEERDRLGRHDREDHVLEDRPDQWPGIGPAAQPAEPGREGSRGPAPLRLQFRVADVFMQPRHEALKVVVDDVIA